jgi:hypothetical protein
VHGLSLPEEFALLCLTADGNADPAQAATGCAAAELGELALRGKVLVDCRKGNIGGLDVYRTFGAEVRLVDREPTGLGWADALMADLAGFAAERGKIVLSKWLRQRRDAFPLHCNALAQRGLVRHESAKHRFRTVNRYLPEPTTRGRLIADIAAASSGMQMQDAHMLLLTDLVVSSGMTRDLHITIPTRQRMARARRSGAVALLPEALLDTSAVLAAMVPRKTSRQN